MRLALEEDVLPMAYIKCMALINGYLVQDDGNSFIGAICGHGREEDAGKIALLEQMDWR